MTEEYEEHDDNFSKPAKAPPSTVKKNEVNRITYLFLLVDRLSRRLQEAKKTYLEQERHENISAFQANILRHIADGSITPRMLISSGCYLGATLTYNIKALTEEKFIERVPARADKRSVQMTVSAKGVRLLSELEIWETAIANDSLSAMEIENCFRVLQTIDSMLQVSQVKPLNRSVVNDDTLE